jgi:hypothetical protein
MAPASTGRLKSSSTAVTNIDQTNKFILKKYIPGALLFIIVTIKFMAPNKELTPAKCRLKIAKSTEGPLDAMAADKGGYTVHPVPTPSPISIDKVSSNKLGGNNQKLMLFRRGKLMSLAPIIIGTNQFPNPPTSIGITIKNIMTKA